MMRESSPSQHVDASISRNHLHWGPSVTTAVAAGAAFVSATAAQQGQTGGAIGYQTIGEPTIVLGQTSFRGGETAMSAPNMGLEARDHSPISPPFPPGFLPLPTEFHGSNSQAWSPLTAFNIVNPMSHHPIHPSYGHDVPSEEINHGHHHPCVTALSDNTSQDLYHPGIMTSNLGFDQPFPFVQDVYLDQEFAFSPDMHPHKMNDFDELDWSVIQPEESGEDAGQRSSTGSSSPTASQPEGAVHIDAQDVDSWGLVLGQTGDIAEVSGGHSTSASSSRRSPRSPSKTTRPRKGRKRAPLGAGEREQTSNTRRMAACVRCQMQRKRVSSRPA
jgi:hypothetical protein